MAAWLVSAGFWILEFTLALAWFSFGVYCFWLLIRLLTIPIRKRWRQRVKTLETK